MHCLCGGFIAVVICVLWVFIDSWVCLCIWLDGCYVVQLCVYWWLLLWCFRVYSFALCFISLFVCLRLGFSWVGWLCFMFVGVYDYLRIYYYVVCDFICFALGFAWILSFLFAFWFLFGYVIGLISYEFALHLRCWLFDVGFCFFADWLEYWFYVIGDILFCLLYGKILCGFLFWVFVLYCCFIVFVGTVIVSWGFALFGFVCLRLIVLDCWVFFASLL